MRAVTLDAARPRVNPTPWRMAKRHAGGKLIGSMHPRPRTSRRLTWFASAVAAALVLAVLGPRPTRAIGEASHVEIRGLTIGGAPEARPLARTRLSWAVRTRTSVETVLAPGRVRLDDPAIFESPMLVMNGESAFPSPSEGEVRALRRFVELGGFVLIDDAAPDRPGFDASVRSLLHRAFPDRPLRGVPSGHTIYRSFYLVRRPLGRVEGPPAVEGIERDGRLAVVYSRHDLGGAWSRDNLGTWTFDVVPGGDSQREEAFRFGVNLVMYALCLDYKDDQVHAPFIMRRRGGAP